MQVSRGCGEHALVLVHFSNEMRMHDESMQPVLRWQDQHLVQLSNKFRMHDEKHAANVTLAGHTQAP